MSEGTVMFVRATDSEAVKLETCGRPVCADDEVKLLDEDDREVPVGDLGELVVFLQAREIADSSCPRGWKFWRISLCPPLARCPRRFWAKWLLKS